MNEGFSHLDERGEAHMVDVADKAVTAREAWATGQVRMAAATLALLRDQALPKGDVLATARIAAIQAAKRTAELIPLCHQLPLSSVKVAFTLDPQLPGVKINARCRVEGRTGVEMEALTAVSVAGLTLYDMCKAVDKGMVIEAVQLEHKSGGKSGVWSRAEAPGAAAAPYEHAAGHTTADDTMASPSSQERDSQARTTQAGKGTVSVLFFAALREEIGLASLEVDLNELATPTTTALKALLVARASHFAALERGKVLCALNRRMVNRDSPLAAGDEIGFFPPVTGG